MNDSLKESMNNIFITSANILDGLTYKLTPAAADTVIPHNNESLMKPMTDILKDDFNTYNEVLDNFNMELLDTEYVLKYLKVKIRKEADLRKKMEEEAKIKKMKEAEHQAALKKAKMAEAKKQEAIKAAAAAAAAAAAVSKKEKEQKDLAQQQQQQQSQKAEDFGKNPDDLLLDLDLDNFNFNQQGQGDNDLLGLGTDALGGTGSTATTANATASNNIMKQAPKSSDKNANVSGIGNVSGTGNVSNGDISQSTAGLDSLNDLNLDFLDNGTDLDQHANGNNNFGSGNDDLGMFANFDSLDNDAGNTNNNPGNGTNNSTNHSNDDASLVPPDQMENLFSQFDDLVGGTGNNGI